MTVGPGAVGLLVGLAVGLSVAAPVLRPGYVLSYDQVAVPRQPITATTLGLDGSVPRAVPPDLVLAALGHVIAADAVQKILLVLMFVLAGWGVARMVQGRLAAAAAALFYTWNTYVAERLVIGHWDVLLGYALLPWTVASTMATRREPRRVFQTCLWLFAAALCGVTTGIVVSAVVLLLLVWPGGLRGERARTVTVTVAAAMAANAPWWLPSLLRPGGIPADPRGVSAFAAHADGPLGVIGSLVTLGGIWNSAVVPPERHVTGLAVAALVGVLVALGVGARSVARWWDGAGSAVLVAGGVALLLSAAARLPVADSLVRAVVLHFPGGGFLRDAQKLLVPFALCVALCVGATVDRLAASRRSDAAVIAAALVALPVVVLPGLAWGVGGRLSVADYPQDWYAARRLIAAAHQPGDVAVLPWRLYRRFSWNANHVVLDPAPRFLPRVVVVNDDLPLTSFDVRGEDPRAARITAAVAAHAPLAPRLRDLGVGFVLVEHTAESPPVELTGAKQVLTGRDLDLYTLSQVRPWHSGVPRFTFLGLVLCAATGVVAAIATVIEKRR